MGMKKAAKRGRPKIDPRAKPRPAMFIAEGARRYRIGRDQMAEAVRSGEVESTMVAGKKKIITSLADKKFGLIPA
jgi:hypothetical protein